MTRFLAVVVFCLPLLGGCAVGDGVAHVAKLIGNSGSSSSDAAPAPVNSAAPAESSLPPPPQAAPRDDIKVEQLGPQH